MTRLVAFAWLGMVLGVSFLATPIKFRAESLTLPVALDVGRATFHAFGKVEWLLSAALLVGLSRIGQSEGLAAVDYSLAATILTIIAVQQLWLIPQLDLRVAAIIAGETLQPSHLHKIFAGLEFAKAVLLLLVGLVTGTKVV